MEILELISNFEPFFKVYIEKFGKAGSGPPSFFLQI